MSTSPATLAPEQQQQLALLLAELASLQPLVKQWLQRRPGLSFSVEVRTPGLPPLLLEWQARR